MNETELPVTTARVTAATVEASTTSVEPAAEARLPARRESSGDAPSQSRRMRVAARLSVRRFKSVLRGCESVLWR